MTNQAIGSGVTPNQRSSVIQTPSSYLKKMSYRCHQYLRGRQEKYRSVLSQTYF